MITLQTPAMSVEIDEEYGATIRRIADSAGRNALAHYDWETPIPAQRGISYGNDDLDFHSGFRGGWQETFPNAGLPSLVDGIPLPFHGEVATARWSVEEIGETSCILRVPSRLPLELTRRMELDRERAVLRIEGEVRNVGSVAAAFVWGQHPAFPATAGARLDFPPGAMVRPDVERAGGLRLDATAWPIAERESGGELDLSIVRDNAHHELFYLDGLGEGWAAIRQPDDTPSVGLAWDNEAYPYSWLWIQRFEPGFPFYGRAAMLAIEAQTSWPYDGLDGALHRDMAHRLDPGETMRSWYTVSLFENTGAPVVGVSRSGDVAFGGRP